MNQQTRNASYLLWGMLVVAGAFVPDIALADVRATVKIRLARQAIRPAISGEEYAGTLEIIAPHDGVIESVEMGDEGWEPRSVGLRAATPVAKGETLKVPFRANVFDATKRLEVRVTFEGQVTTKRFDLSPERFARIGRDRPTVQVATTSERLDEHVQASPPDSDRGETGTRGCDDQVIRIRGRIVYQRTWRDNSSPPDGDFNDPGIDNSVPLDGDFNDPADVMPVDYSVPPDGDFTDPGDVRGIDNSFPPDGDFNDPGDVPPDLAPATIGVDGIWFEVIDDDSPDPIDEVMFSSFTDVNGYFDVTICWDDCDVSGCDDPDIYVRYECDTGVVNVQDGYDPLEEDYSWSTEDSLLYDDYTGNDIDFGTLQPSDVDVFPALHIHNSVTRAHRFILENNGDYLPEVDAQWPEDSTEYNPFFEEIYVDPTQEWNEGSQVHEWGHHLFNHWLDLPDTDYCNGFCDDELPNPCQANEPCVDSGGHCVWCQENDVDAWNEGFANWLGSVLLRNWPVRYGIGPWTQLMGSNNDGRYTLETVRPCCGTPAPGTLHDPWTTEGFVAALLRDIEDPRPETPGVTCPTDALALGAEEILTVVRQDQPIRIVEFIERFLSRYPQYAQDLWSTASAVAPVYVTTLPDPPIEVYQLSTCETFRAGETITLSVITNGSPFSLSFQWYRNGVAMINGGRISGANSDVLTITNAEVGDSGAYALSITKCNRPGTVLSPPIPVHVFGGNGPAHRVTGWGRGDFGQLGRGTVTPSPGWDVNPADVINLNNVVAVSAGYWNSVALLSDGTVWSWGAAYLGNGTSQPSAAPVQVNNLSDIVAVSAGGNQTNMALDANGHVWTWGSNWAGHLGYPQPSGVALNPGQVNLDCVVDISTGVYHAAAVTSDGSLWTWGYNGNGQLGQGTVGGSVGYNGPVRVTDLSNIVKVSCGAGHILALRADGTVWACGNNGNGQLGDGTTTDRSRFVQVTGINDAVGISAGYYHSLAKRSDLTPWAWGANGNHELGTGAYQFGGPYSTPARVLNPPTVRSLDGGNGSSVFVAGDGTLWTCGFNGNGDLGRGPTPNTLDYLPAPVDTRVGAAVSASAGGNFMMVIAPGARIIAPVADKFAAGCSDVQLAVSAVGEPPLTYSWRRDNVLLGNSGRISGADGPVLTISTTNTNDTGTYTVRVSNAANSADSNPVILVTPPLLIGFDTQLHADAWFTNQRGAWAVTGGGYAATAPSWSPATYNGFRLPLTDFAVEFDVLNASWAGYAYNSGIWLRSSLKSHRYAPDSPNPYGVLLTLGDALVGQLDAGDLYWTRWHGGGAQSAQGIAPNVFHTGDTVHLRVEVRGSTYSAYVNDSATPTTQLTTTEFPAGSLALFDSSPADPLFDNVFIQTLPSCDPGSGMEPVRILQRPQSQTVPSGTQATLDVVATGTGPLNYQWLRGGLCVAGANSPTYSFAATASTAGRYECTVTNSCGSVGSFPAIITVEGAGVPAATLTAAVSRKANTAGPGGDCDLPLIPGGQSEPRQGGITELWLVFDVIPGGPGGSPVSIEQATCPAPAFVAYSGASTLAASQVGNSLRLTFTPGLENGRTYRLSIGSEVTSIPGQSVEVSGLIGDVNSDGRVNAADRSAVVGAWTGGGFSCPTDLNSDGRTNAADRSAVVGGWTGGQNCAP